MAFLLALVPLALPWGLVCFGGLAVIFFFFFHLGVFMRWSSTHGKLASGFWFLAQRSGHCSWQCPFLLAWMSPWHRVGVCPSLPFRIVYLSLRFLLLSAGSFRSPEFLRFSRSFLWCGSPVQFVTLTGVSFWLFRAWLGLGGAPPDIRRACFSFLNALFVLASASTRRFGYSMLCFSVALLPGAGVGCPLLSSRAL